jgi:hypothetical protein
MVLGQLLEVGAEDFDQVASDISQRPAATVDPEEAKWSTVSRNRRVPPCSFFFGLFHCGRYCLYMSVSSFDKTVSRM